MDLERLDSSPRPGYPSFADFRANRRDFLRALAAGAAAPFVGAALPGCDRDPAPRAGTPQVVPPASHAAVSAAQTAPSRPGGGVVSELSPPPSLSPPPEEGCRPDPLPDVLRPKGDMARPQPPPEPGPQPDTVEPPPDPPPLPGGMPAPAPPRPPPEPNPAEPRDPGDMPAPRPPPPPRPEGEEAQTEQEPEPRRPQRTGGLMLAPVPPGPASDR